jgi:hypothetical protein
MPGYLLICVLQKFLAAPSHKCHKGISMRRIGSAFVGGG